MVSVTGSNTTIGSSVIRVELDVVVAFGITLGEVTTNGVTVPGSAGRLAGTILVALDNTLVCGELAACDCQLQATKHIRKTALHTTVKPILPLLYM